MKKIAFIFVFVAFMSGVTAAQKAKPWAEWDKKDIEKMLNNSAWGQTQTGTDMSTKYNDLGQTRVMGSSNESHSYNYRVRLFSARPIREAFARKVMLDNPQIKASQLENFVIGDYSEMIVVAVAFDATDPRYSIEIGKAFSTATTDILRKGGTVYLETNDGKHIYLDEYVKPASDGTGAKFVFPRNIDGAPFIKADSGGFRFVAMLGDGVSISRRFKISDMMYDGKLEL